MTYLTFLLEMLFPLFHSFEYLVVRLVAIEFIGVNKDFDSFQHISPSGSSPKLVLM